MNDGHVNEAQWTDQCLAALPSDGVWTRDAARGLSRLKEKLNADARGKSTGAGRSVPWS